MNYTPQGGTIEGNAADDILMVDQGRSIAFLAIPCRGREAMTATGLRLRFQPVGFQAGSRLAYSPERYSMLGQIKKRQSLFYAA